MFTGLSFNCSHVGKFVRGTDGGVTLRAIRWFPVYIVIFLMVADFSLMFQAQAKATRIAFDGNRQASLGALATETEVERAILNRLVSLSPQAKVNTVFSTGAITTTLTMPASDLLTIGSLLDLINLDITVSSVHSRSI